MVSMVAFCLIRCMLLCNPVLCPQADYKSTCACQLLRSGYEDRLGEGTYSILDRLPRRGRRWEAPKYGREMSAQAPVDLLMP